MSRRAGCRVVLIGRSGGRRSLTNEQNYHRANEFCFRFFNLETFKAATTTTFTATTTTTTKTTMPQTPSRCRDCTRLSDRTDGQSDDWLNERSEERMDCRTNGQTDEWTDGRTNGRTEPASCRSDSPLVEEDSHSVAVST